MKILDFINEYEKCNDADKERYIKKHIISTYMNYEEKCSMCERIIESTMNKKTESGESMFYCNSTARYMLFILSIIKNYTDIDIDFKESLDCFNKLDEKNLIDVIIVNIPESEISKLNTILDMVESDFYENNRSVMSFIDSNNVKLKLFVLKLKGILDRLITDDKYIDKITKKLEKLVKQ